MVSFGLVAVLMQHGRPLAFISQSFSDKVKLKSAYLWAGGHGHRVCSTVSSHFIIKSCYWSSGFGWRAAEVGYDFEFTIGKGRKKKRMADVLSKMAGYLVHYFQW
jgi:hypothetical protein